MDSDSQPSELGDDDDIAGAFDSPTDPLPNAGEAEGVEEGGEEEEEEEKAEESDRDDANADDESDSYTATDGGTPDDDSDSATDSVLEAGDTDVDEPLQEGEAGDDSVLEAGDTDVDESPQEGEAGDDSVLEAGDTDVDEAGYNDNDAPRTPPVTGTTDSDSLAETGYLPGTQQSATSTMKDFPISGASSAVAPPSRASPRSPSSRQSPLPGRATPLPLPAVDDVDPKKALDFDDEEVVSPKRSKGHAVRPSSTLPELRGYLDTFMAESGIAATLLSNKRLLKFAADVGANDWRRPRANAEGIWIKNLRTESYDVDTLVVPMSTSDSGVIVGPPVLRSRSLSSEMRNVVRLFLALRFSRLADRDKVDDSKMGDLKFTDEPRLDIARSVLTDEYMRGYTAKCVAGGLDLCKLPRVNRVMQGNPK